MPLTRLAEFHTHDGPHRRLRLRATLLAGPSAPLEWLYGIVKICWGGWLLLPLHTFAAAPHLYRLAAAVAPEWAWGLLWVATGACQLAAWYWDWRRLRFACNVLGACLWTGYAALLWAGDTRSSAPAFFAPLAAFQVLAAIWLFPQMLSPRTASGPPVSGPQVMAPRHDSEGPGRSPHDGGH